MVAPGYDPPIMAVATSTYVGGVPIGYVTPATVGTTSAVGSTARPVVGNGIVAIVGCSATSKGAP